MLTTAGALAAIGGGIASVLYAGNIAEQARRECPARVTCDDERQRVRTWDTLALGGFVVGAGLGVLSVVLWTRKSRSTAAIHATTNTSVSRSLRSTSARLGFSAQSFTIAGEF